MRSSFRCPTCGSTTWGSSYNFDGPGDTPIRLDATGLDSGGRSVEFKGTFTRLCHGYLPTSDGGFNPCSHTWNSRDDAKHGLGLLPQRTVTGWAPPRVPRS